MHIKAIILYKSKMFALTVLSLSNTHMCMYVCIYVCMCDGFRSATQTAAVTRGVRGPVCAD